MPWWVCLHWLHQQIPWFFDIGAWEGQKQLIREPGLWVVGYGSCQKEAGHPGPSRSLRFLQVTQAFSESPTLGEWHRGHPEVVSSAWMPAFSTWAVSTGQCWHTSSYFWEVEQESKNVGTRAVMDWLRATLRYFEGEGLDMCSQGIKVSATPSCNHKLVSQVSFGAVWIILASRVKTQRWMWGGKGMALRKPGRANQPCPVQFTFVVNGVTPCTFRVWWLLSAGWGSLRLLSSLILFLSCFFFFFSLFIGHFSHPYNSYELLFH